MDIEYEDSTTKRYISDVDTFLFQAGNLLVYVDRIVRIPIKRDFTLKISRVESAERKFNGKHNI